MFVTWVILQHITTELFGKLTIGNKYINKFPFFIKKNCLSKIMCYKEKTLTDTFLYKSVEVHTCVCIHNICWLCYKKMCSWNHGIIRQNMLWNWVKFKTVDNEWLTLPLKKTKFLNIWDKWKCVSFVVCTYM